MHGNAPVPLQDSLSQLQILLIELQYTIADVAYEVSFADKLEENDFLPLREHALIVDIAANNLILSARAALSRELHVNKNPVDNFKKFRK
jgi:hypothetical protein